MLTNVPYGRGLFERHVDNPIIRARDLPYRCNTVFNAAAAQVDGEGQPVGSDMTSPPWDTGSLTMGARILRPLASLVRASRSPSGEDAWQRLRRAAFLSEGGPVRSLSHLRCPN